MEKNFDTEIKQEISKAKFRGADELRVFIESNQEQYFGFKDEDYTQRTDLYLLLNNTAIDSYYGLKFRNLYFTDKEIKFSFFELKVKTKEDKNGIEKWDKIIHKKPKQATLFTEVNDNNEITNENIVEINSKKYILLFDNILANINEYIKDIGLKKYYSYLISSKSYGICIVNKKIKKLAIEEDLIHVLSFKFNLIDKNIQISKTQDNFFISLCVESDLIKSLSEKFFILKSKYSNEKDKEYTCGYPYLLSIILNNIFI